MDNNKQQAPQPAPNMPSNPVPGPVLNEQSSSGNNKMVLWFVMGLVVIILLVGGIYFFLSRQSANSQSQATQTPAPVAQENLENELNSINIDASANDFSSVDQDLKQL